MHGESSYQGGALWLTGPGAYVDLPNGLISALPALTVEVWLTWTNPEDGNWQRVFDFGSNDFGEVGPGDTEPFSGANHRFLQVTPRSSEGAVRATLNQSPDPFQIVLGDEPLPADQRVHVAVTVDPQGSVMRLFVDGTELGREPVDIALSDIEDVNNWLGRSNYAVDDYLQGGYHELRLWGRALHPAEIHRSFVAGPERPAD